MLDKICLRENSGHKYTYLLEKGSQHVAHMPSGIRVKTFKDVLTEEVHNN